MLPCLCVWWRIKSEFETPCSSFSPECLHVCFISHQKGDLSGDISGTNLMRDSITQWMFYSVKGDRCGTVCGRLSLITAPVQVCCGRTCSTYMAFKGVDPHFLASYIVPTPTMLLLCCQIHVLVHTVYSGAVTVTVNLNTSFKHVWG